MGSFETEDKAADIPEVITQLVLHEM